MEILRIASWHGMFPAWSVGHMCDLVPDTCTSDHRL